jgi:hypothetical protein
MATAPGRRLARLAVALGVGLALDLAGLALAQPPKAAEPLDRQPYRIRLILTIDPEARFDARRRDVLLGDWKTLVRRFVGAPWKIEVAEESQGAVIGSDLETIQVKDLAEASRNVDKVWVVRLGAEGSGLVFSGRELDVSTDRLGPIQRRPAAVVRDAPRALFQFTLELFSPYAEIGETFGKNVALNVRGASIAPATPIGRVVSEGTIFLPLRIVPRKDGTKQVREIVNTFLRVEDVQGAAVRCGFVSLYSNPFTKMVVQKTSLAAIGVKPGRTPTRLRFVTLPDRAPAAGYLLTARSYPDGVPREVGTTDREGRVVIDPTGADGLLVLRLLAGSSEPMYDFPLMPGLSAAERTMPPFDPKPLAVALETQLDSLRDAVIDLVAVRARLEARLKARFDGEDYKGAEEAMNEYHKLTPRATFADELTHLKDEAARQQAAAKKPVLTKTAQAQLTDLQALIDRYLDDDVFKAYDDALAQLKTEPAAKPKGKVAAKAPAAAAAKALTPAAPPAPAPAAPKAPAPPKAAGGGSSPVVPF